MRGKIIRTKTVYRKASKTTKKSFTRQQRHTGDAVDHLHWTVTSVCCLIGSLRGMLLARHSNLYLSCPAGLLILLIRSVDAPLPVMLVWFGSAQVTLGVGTPLAAQSRIRSPPSRTTFAAGGTLVKLAGTRRKKAHGWGAIGHTLTNKIIPLQDWYCWGWPLIKTGRN